MLGMLGRETSSMFTIAQTMIPRVLPFFFQADDGIRDVAVTGVQTCALPISQAVLPLRGKVLNTMSKDSRTVLANKELQAIATAIGVDPHSSEENIDLNGLRYGKVIVMTDADVDGGHIKALLLTFFFMHAPRLVERGHLYVAQPPI